MGYSCLEFSRVADFRVVSLVTWPLIESEVGVDWFDKKKLWGRAISKGKQVSISITTTTTTQFSCGKLVGA